jgi:flavin-dependent dehydrogenase
VLQNHRIRNLSKHPEGWSIVAEHENTHKALEAKVLIGADGRNSRVAHHVGFANYGTRPGKAVGFQFRLNDFDRIRGRVEIHVFPGGYAGLVQLGDGTANLCVSVTRDKLSKRRRVDLPSSLGLTLNPFLKELICGAELFHEVHSIFPVYFPPRRCYAERLLLVGDAARVIEPVTGEGVYFAMRSGLLAANTIDEALQGGDFSASHLREYERRCRREFRRRRGLNRLIQYLVYRPAVSGHLVRISSKRGILLGSIVNSIFLPGDVGSQPAGWR